jgi:pullulanase/glycogen debranching enzyme
VDRLGQGRHRPGGVHPQRLGPSRRAPGLPAPTVLVRPAGPSARDAGTTRHHLVRTRRLRESDDDWDSGFAKSIAVFLNGNGIPDLDVRGQRVTDDSFVLCFNAHHDDIEFAMPTAEFGATWIPVVDTTFATGALEHRMITAGGSITVPARALVALQAGAEEV